MTESIYMVMNRIAVAEPGSPIAVFRNQDGTFKTQFAAPLRTRQLIEMRPPNLLGVWCNQDNQHTILAALGYVKPGKHPREKVTIHNRDVVKA